MRDWLEGKWRHQGLGAAARVCGARLLYRLKGTVRGHNNYTRLIHLGHRVHGNSRRRKRHHLRRRLCQSVRSEGTTSGSTTTQTVMLALAMSEARSQAQTRAHTPAGVPIPSSPSPPSPPSPHLLGDLSMTPTSFVMAPPTIVSRRTDSGGDGRTPEMRNDTEHYAPPHTRGFVPSLI